MTTIRKGDIVSLSAKHGRAGSPPSTSRQGKVLAFHQRPMPGYNCQHQNTSTHTHYLVKWTGRSFPLDQCQVDLIFIRRPL